MTSVRSLATALLIGLVASATASAAASLDGARQSAQAAWAKVETLRQRQTALRQQLNATGDRIAALKSSGRRVIGSAALDGELRRSQELSSTLGGLATEIAAAEAEANGRDVALVEALSAELEALRARTEATSDRARRAELYATMRALRAERDQRRRALPSSGVPSFPDARGDDDPEDLLEQADAYRDAEDKLRARVAALDQRITEVRAERELDRRMQEFAEDEAIFDEQDRRLDRSPSGSRGAGAELAGDVHPPGGSATPAPSSSGASSGSVASTASPNMLGDEGTAPAAAAGPRDGLRALELERDRLRALADELARKARAAEDRAHSLE